ncbi:MAG: hypothetical protein QNJ72_08500 [Pleurocapsa sp. MO_226.B13]|nr:hypothetical protein [Pleurocapsa sp. MO_226.B13]
MKRPSNVILAFISMLVATFVIWIVWLIVLQATQSPEIKIEEDSESQLDDRYKIL